MNAQRRTVNTKIPQGKEVNSVRQLEEIGYISTERNKGGMRTAQQGVMLATLHLRRRLHLNAGDAGGHTRPGRRDRDASETTRARPEPRSGRNQCAMPGPFSESPRPAGQVVRPAARGGDPSPAGGAGQRPVSPHTCGMGESRVATTGRPGSRPNLNGPCPTVARLAD